VSRKSARLRTHASRSPSSRSTWAGIIMIAVSLIAILGLLTTFLVLSYSQSGVNAATFCPEDGPTSITVVLIDATDPLGPSQAQALENRIASIQEGIERGGALELYLVAPIERAPLEPLLKLCNPGRPEEASKWAENPRIVEQRWREGFTAPIQEAVRRAQEAEEAATSPILASLQSVALTAFGGPGRNDRPKRLLLISDLLENTSAFSLYQSPPDAARFLADPRLRSLRPPLEGVEVQLRIVDRGHPRQTPELGRFWEELIAAGGGEVTIRGPLVGIAG
jgi:hypothetical protein